MHRFYFDILSEFGQIRDDKGVIANSLEEALQYAQFEIEDIKNKGEIEKIGRGWYFIIRSENGTILARIDCP